MANTFQDYTATAGQTDFAFTFDYLEDEHVTVEINGVVQLTSDYSIIVESNGDTKVRLNVGATEGAIVRVRRKSQPDTNLVDFVNGSVLTESELDRAYLHNRYLAEEIAELNEASLQLEQGGTQWDAKGLRIKNVGTPTATEDATNKTYVDNKVNQVSNGTPYPPTKWVFTGNAGANTTYTVTGAEINGDTAYDLSIDGVVKEPTTDYTVDPDTDVLTIIPSLSGGENIVVIQRGFGVAIAGTVGTNSLVDGSVTSPKLAEDAVTTAKIIDGAVTTAKISGASDLNITATDSITARSLADRFADSINVLDYGVVFDDEASASANVTALNAAITQALTNNSCLYIPQGKLYLDQQLTINGGEYSLRVLGAGKNVTKLCWTASATSVGIVFNLYDFGAVQDNKASVAFEQFELLIKQSNVGVALQINGDAQKDSTAGGVITDRLHPRVLIKELNIRGETYTSHGWQVGLDLDNTHIVFVEGLNTLGRIDGSLNTPSDHANAYQVSESGIKVRGDGSPTNIVFDRIYVQAYQYGLVIQETAEGIFVSNSTFIVCRDGVYMASNDTNTAFQYEPMLNVLNCHFDIFRYGIFAENVAQGNLQSNLMYIRLVNPSTGGDPDYTEPCSILLSRYTTEFNISNNIFIDTEVGYRGPSVVVNGQGNSITDNIFRIDHDATADEPKIQLGNTSFANIIRGNKIVKEGAATDLNGSAIEYNELTDDYLYTNLGPTHSVVLTNSKTLADFTDNGFAFGQTSGALAHIRKQTGTQPANDDLLFLQQVYGKFSTGESILDLSTNNNHGNCFGTITRLESNDVHNLGTSLASTGWVTEDKLSTALANGADMQFDTFRTDIAAEDYIVQVWLAKDDGGTDAITLSSGTDYQVYKMQTNEVRMYLHASGFQLFSNTGTTSRVSYATGGWDYIKVIVQAR